MSHHPGHAGASMQGVQKSPDRVKRDQRRRRRQEAAWAARSGPVVVRQAVSDQSAAGDEVPADE